MKRTIMRKVFLFISILSTYTLKLGAEPVSQEEIASFFNTYGATYQDIVIQNQVYPTGLHFCDNRYELIRPVLDRYKNQSFSLLDIGASQGYFSFRIAQDYPSVCLMLEGALYPNHLKILEDLCRFNSHLKNVFLLPYMMDMQSLNNLSRLFQFDVVLALLVIHQIAEKDVTAQQSHFQNAVNIFNTILKCGKDVIVETSLDVFPEFDRYVSEYCHKSNGKYLGEVQREKQSERWTSGRLYWFSR
jgi:hypothetical protein